MSLNSKPRWPELEEAATLMEEEGRKNQDVFILALGQWLRVYSYQATIGNDPYPSLPLVVAREYLRERRV